MLLVHKVISAEQSLVLPIVTRGSVFNRNGREVLQLGLLLGPGQRLSVWLRHAVPF
jgi:hypothetical protein